MADIKLLYGTKTNFDASNTKPQNVLGSLYLATVDDARSYLYFGNGTNFLNVVPELLTVANGGTGATTFQQGQVLIGNGANAVTTKAITDKSSSYNFSSTSTNLVTERTVYNFQGSSNISKVGIITSGTWQATDIGVAYGGTGRSEFTNNGVVYGGNGNNALQVTAAGAKGQVLSPNANGVPEFTSPQVSWDAGTSAGPIFKLTIHGQEYTKVIPSASADASGIITNNAQIIGGDKTFIGTTVTRNIRPETAENSTVPLYTSGTSSYPWKEVHGVAFIVKDSALTQIGKFYPQTEGTTLALGESVIEIGNDSAQGAAGNARGNIYLYGSTSTYTRIITNVGTNNKTVTIPNLSGNMVLAKTEEVNAESATSYFIPFYDSKYQSLGCNDGFQLITLNGKVGSNGKSELVLGNANPNKTAGHKYGSIKLFGVDDESFIITPNPNTKNEATDISEYTAYLPVIDGTGKGELLYHPINESIGTDSRPVYIGQDGKPIQVNQVGVPYGGTGVASFTTNGVLYGNNNSALQVTAAGEQGTILSPNASNVPSFASPSWTWTGGTSNGPTLTLTIQGKDWTTAAVPKASSSASGIVTTGSQTFAGAKTFSGVTKITNNTTSSSKTTGALVVTGGAGIGGSLYANAISSTTTLSAGTTLTVGGAGTIGGDLTVNGGEIYLGTTSEHCTMSYDTATDTLTISFPT